LKHSKTKSNSFTRGRQTTRRGYIMSIVFYARKQLLLSARLTIAILFVRLSVRRTGESVKNGAS